MGYFYGLIWGTRTAIIVGVIIEGLTLVIGIVIGAVSAFYGGWLDEVLMRITEIFLAFPFIMAALTLSAVLTPTMDGASGRQPSRSWLSVG